MKTSLKRREFILKSCKAGMAGCALLYSAKLFGAGNLKYFAGEGVPDPKKLNYCGYTCSPECKMMKATVENSIELKKEAYKDWRIEEKYGIAFDPEKITCYGCKVSDDKVGWIASQCTVRNCVIEKGYECCIQCTGLLSCDKELWKNFPDFHKHMIELQKQFIA